MATIFVKTETIAAGMAATAVVGFAFSFLLGGPVGLLGYGLIMAGVGALIDDKLIKAAYLFSSFFTNKPNNKNSVIGMENKNTVP